VGKLEGDEESIEEVLKKLYRPGSPRSRGKRRGESWEGDGKIYLCGIRPGLAYLRLPRESEDPGDASWRRLNNFII